jgi:hypothetical protein
MLRYAVEADAQMLPTLFGRSFAPGRDWHDGPAAADVGRRGVRGAHSAPSASPPGEGSGLRGDSGYIHDTFSGGGRWDQLQPAAAGPAGVR